VFAASTVILIEPALAKDTDLGATSVFSSSVRLDANVFERCQANSMIVGSAYAVSSFSRGGGISIGFGVVVFSSIFAVFQMQNITVSGSVSSSNNVITYCSASIIADSERILFDPVASGGGISLHMGSLVFARVSKKMQAFVNFVGSMEAKGNVMQSCHATVNFAFHGGMVSGGGLFMSISGHSHLLVQSIGTFFSDISTLAPAALISSNSQMVSQNNSLYNCSAISGTLSSYGGSVRGGGISMLVGSSSVIISIGYLYLIQGSAPVSTAADSYQVSAVENFVSDCFVVLTSKVASRSGTASGGGIDVMIGASCLSFSSIGTSLCSSGDVLFTSNTNFSGNVVSRCNASLTSGSYSTASRVYGGCSALNIGSIMSANGQISGGSSTFSAAFVVANNDFSHCSLDFQGKGEVQTSLAHGGKLSPCN
jgi:hypothetical protein